MNHTGSAALPPARRANDYLTRHKRFREREMLFDEFWREGELALFFGAAGTGKSVLAVQLADALSRGGGGLGGFRGPGGRRRVLYVDLRHTDEQFRRRCSMNGSGSPHRFPRSLLRDRPAPGRDLCDWLRAYVVAHGIQAVIVDDLSAVKNTHDGTRETLALMRRLRGLRDELGISILVLAESNEPPRRGPVSEADLGRSRVLCTAADSIFAAGRACRRDGDGRYLVQTRSRSARVYWTSQNAPTAHLSSTATGLLCFEFDERFGEQMPEEKRRLICEVARLHEVEFKPFREIARELGISKSWACSLYRKWTPAMESGLQEEGDNTTGSECAQFERLDTGVGQTSSPPYQGGEAEGRGGSPQHETGSTPGHEGPAGGEAASSFPPYQGGVNSRVFQREDGVVLSERAEIQLQSNMCSVEENHPGSRSKDDRLPPLLGKEGSPSDADVPVMLAPARSSIYDLTRALDGYGNEIYIESRCDHTGKPALWYKLDKKGLKRRFTRDTLGVKVEYLDAGPFL